MGWPFDELIAYASRGTRPAAVPRAEAGTAVTVIIVTGAGWLTA
jgi:hypothetical protein